MANKQIFIPKDNQNLPDTYGMEIEFINGKTKKFEIAEYNISHKVYEQSPDGSYGWDANPSPVLEFCTKDDEWHWIPMGNILMISWDKNFSKMIEERRKEIKESQNKTLGG